MLGIKTKGMKKILISAAPGAAAGAMVSAAVQRFAPQFTSYANMAGLVGAYMVGGVYAAGGYFIMSGGVQAATDNWN